ncbi:hypothetical protein GCM10023189_08460 [Nibrella saemangeumensis]|uniref:Outer membrane protein beta-barrel domain-containing protein n=1 Tax=Nibrella saemangeumensis TaxID=1084526 RepID=A0ABP8MHP5_9BACT
MNPSNQHTPDDRWRKAFEEASETPPPRVWDAIERRLDEDDDRAGIVPLWRQYMPWASGVAAAVALLLVGWWLMRTDSPTGTDVARQQSERRPEAAAQQQTPAAENNTTSTTESVVAGGAEQSLAGDLKRGSSSQEVSPPDDWNHPHYARTYDPLAKERIRNRQQSKTAIPATADELMATEQIALSASPAAMSVPGNALIPSTNTLVPGNASLPIPSQMPPNERPLSGYPVQEMQGHGLQSGLRETQRMVWFRAPDADALPEAEIKKNQREMWASVSVMPSSFNPAVSVRSSVPMANYAMAPGLANQNTKSTPSVQSRSDLSMAYQAGTGLQLTDHWSVETGVAYLAGRSTVASPVLVSVATASGNPMMRSTNNFFAEAVKNAPGNANVQNDRGGITYLSNQNLYDAGTLQSVSNDYRFVQVPVQVGYQLRPNKPLGIALLGGMLANWFVRNDVGDNLSVKANDGFYKPVTLSGVAGMRLRYRPTRRWSASMAGVYQRALQSGTQPSIELQTRPQTMGMSFGVNYHF